MENINKNVEMALIKDRIRKMELNICESCGRKVEETFNHEGKKYCGDCIEILKLIFHGDHSKNYR